MKNASLYQQPPLFHASSNDEFPKDEEIHNPEIGRTFETDVTRVIHSGLVLRPVYELEYRWMRQNEEDDRREAWEKLDVIWLAFAILDVISEMTEYSAGVTREDVIEKVMPLSQQQAVAGNIQIRDDLLIEILHKIFDHLVNRENRYLPFAYAYFDAGSGRFVSRKFWLVKNLFTEEGKAPLFYLTEEGYTAYFGLHETGALDAAAIGNLRIRLLIERGHVDDAITVAEQNRRQCMRKSHEIRRFRRLIRRSIRSVDFEQLMVLSKEGVHSASQIQKESQRLRNLVRDKIMSIRQNADSPAYGREESAQQEKLQILAEHLEKLNFRLLELSGELLRLPDEYDRHSARLFRRRSAGVLPDTEEVMRRVCLMNEEAAARTALEFIARFDPPVTRPVFDPASVMEACDRALERQNTPGDHTLPVQELDNQAILRFERELDDEIMVRAYDFLEANVGSIGEIRLSRFLAKACKDESAPLMPVASAMTVFQCLADRKTAEKYSVSISLGINESPVRMKFPDGRVYRGDELVLRSRLKENKS